MLLEAERCRDKSLDALRLPLLKSKWRLESDEASEDVDRLDVESRGLSLGSAPRLSVNPAVELELQQDDERGPLASPSVALFLSSAESKLRVCCSFLFARVLEPDEEHEKTLFSKPCADIPAI